MRTKLWFWLYTYTHSESFNEGNLNTKGCFYKTFCEITELIAHITEFVTFVKARDLLLVQNKKKIKESKQYHAAVAAAKAHPSIRHQISLLSRGRGGIIRFFFFQCWIVRCVKFIIQLL